MWILIEHDDDDGAAAAAASTGKASVLVDRRLRVNCGVDSTRSFTSSRPRSSCCCCCCCVLMILPRLFSFNVSPPHPSTTTSNKVLFHFVGLSETFLVSFADDFLCPVHHSSNCGGIFGNTKLSMVGSCSDLLSGSHAPLASRIIEWPMSRIDLHLWTLPSLILSFSFFYSFSVDFGLWNATHKQHFFCVLLVQPEYL